jgi:hypothetical protein
MAIPSTVGHLRALTATLPDGHGLVLSRRIPNAGLARDLDVLVTSDNAVEIADHCARLGQQSDLYVSCCATSTERFAAVCADPGRRRGGAEDMTTIVAVFADIDVGTMGHKSSQRLAPTLDDADRILAAGLPPSMVVATGGGVHAWWLLSEPFSIESDVNRARGVRLLREWVHTIARQAREVGGWQIDLGIGDAGRVLRVCGTWNHKAAPARRVTLRSCGAWPIGGQLDDQGWRPGPLYSVEQLEAALNPIVVEVQPTRSERNARPTPIAARGDGPNILEALGVLEWSDIWPAGWTLVGHENIGGTPVELWRRPDASSHCSAKCWPGEGCQVWSDAVPGLPAGAYSRAEVLAWRSAVTVSELASELTRQARRRLRSLGGAA